MNAGKKMLLVARKKLTPSPDNCKNNTAEFRPPVPGDPGRVVGCIAFGVHSIL